ncbi:hypothetical protein ACWDXD_24765 [Streptomyces sp. NPDC003314]
MSSVLAFVAAAAITAVGAFAARALVRSGTRPAARLPVPDGEAWKRVHHRRREAYTEFTEPAVQIAAIAELWPALPLEARRARQEAARKYLRDLEERRWALVLESSPAVRAAAGELAAACEELVHGLDVDAAPGPVRPAYRDLTVPFLRVCRQHLENEDNAHFGLRRPPGTSLFARLSMR